MGLGQVRIPHIHLAAGEHHIRIRAIVDDYDVVVEGVHKP